MLKQFLPNKRILYLNDRHEEADTQNEDRRKLYDKRILPLLKKGDLAIFAGKIDPFLWDYYRKLNLATVQEKDIFFVENYLDHPSLTKSVINKGNLLENLKRKADLLCPYIESYDTEVLAEKISLSMLRRAEIVDWINNKFNYRQVIEGLGFPKVPGYRVGSLEGAQECFKKLKEQGFKKAVLKKERSVAGFGVFVVKNKEELKKVLREKFFNRKSFLIEGFIENISIHPNIQYWVGDRNIEFLTLTDQIIGKDQVSYQGSQYHSKLENYPEIKEKIEGLSLKFCQFLQKEKCYGLVGIDWLVTKGGQAFSTEANVRWNASTFCDLIAKKLFPGGKISWKSFSILSKPISFFSFFKKFEKHFITPKNRFGIFPLGVDLLFTLGEAQFISFGRNPKDNHGFTRIFYG